MLRFMLISLLFMSLSGSVFAQTTGLIIYPNEFLGYIRIENGEKEYVLHNQGEPITYLLPQDKCFGISGDGRYIGVFNQGESSIDIFYSLRNELIATNIWIDKIFDYCGLIWDSDNKTIRVLKSVDPFIFHQFYFDVAWDGIDVLLVDLPPGTGDAPLSLSQTMPLTGAIMVSMPQKVSLIDVHKGISMFNQVKVPILGVLENMSHYECAACHHREEIFDHGRVRKFCDELGVAFLGDIPIDPMIRARCDEGIPFMADFPDSRAGKAISQIATRLQPFLRTSDELDGDALKIVV